MRTFPGARTGRFRAFFRRLSVPHGGMRDMPTKVTRVASLAVASLMAAGWTWTGSAAAQQQGHRVPADSQTPAAGFCDHNAHERYVEVDLTPDAPSPRCWEVRPGQRLRVHNPSTATSAARVHWRPYGVTVIAPGATVTFNRPFASYLTPGDHDAAVSTYHGSSFEVDLPSHRHAQPVSAG